MVDVLDKIVNLEFNNQDFERNAKTSLSTLEKLKKALNFDGAADGLSKLGNFAKSINLDALNNAVDSVGDRFSAMGVVATTALVNIANRAVDTGIKLVKSLTLDNVTAGFSKYEESLKSINTIMSALPDMGMDAITEQLDKLKWYADETSYDYQAMVKAVSSFTSQNIPLEDATDQMQGIANLAGLAGVEASQATHAFEGFAKAMAAGYMSSQNWSWIKTAGLETMATKEELIKAGIQAKTLYRDSKGVIRISKELYKNSKGLEDDVITVENAISKLSSKWLSDDVMKQAFKNMSEYSVTVKNFQEVWEELTGEYLSASEAMDILNDTSSMSSKELDVLTEATSRLLGETVTTEQAVYRLNNTVSHSAKAGFEAAQQYRTFNDAIEATKVAVTTAWSSIFESLFGNAEEAKITWSRLGNWLWDEFASPFVDFADIVAEWSSGGGRDNLIESLANIGNAYSELKSTFVDAFEWFVNPAAKAFQTIEDGAETLDNTVRPALKTTRELIASANPFKLIAKEEELARPNLKKGREMIEEVNDELIVTSDELYENWSLLGSLRKRIESATSKLRKFTDSLWVYNEATGEREPSERFAEVLEKLGRAARGVFNAFGLVGDVVRVFTSSIKRVFGGEMDDVGDQILDVAANFGDWITNIRESGTFIDKLSGKVNKFMEALRPVANFLGNVIPTAIEGFQNGGLKGAFVAVFEEAAEALEKVFSEGGIFTKIGDGIGIIGQKLSDFTGVDITWLTSFLQTDFSQIDEFLPKLEPLVNFFSSFIDNFKQTSEEHGEGLAGFIAGVFDSIAKGLQAVSDTGLLSSIGGGIKELGEAIKDWTGIDITWFTEFVDKVLGKVEEKLPALEPLLKFFGEVIPTFKKAFDENGGGLKGGVEGFFAALTTGLTAIAETIKNLTGIDLLSFVGIINDVFNAVGTVLGLIVDTITGFWNAIKSALDWAKENIDWKSISNVLTPIWEFIKTLVTDILDFLGERLGKVNFTTLFQLIGLLIEGLAGFELYKILKNVRWSVEEIQEILDNFGSANYYKSRAEALLKAAEAIIILVGAMLLLSSLDSNEAGMAMLELLGLFSVLGIFMKALDGLNTLSSKGGIKGIMETFSKNATFSMLAGAITKLATSVLILTAALKVVDTLESPLKSLAIVGSLVVGMAGIVKWLSTTAKEGMRLASGLGGLLAISTAVMILTGAIALLTAIDDMPQVFVSALIISGMTALLAGLAKMLSDTKGIAAAAFGMIEMSTALLIMVGALAAMSAFMADKTDEEVFGTILNLAGALLVLIGAVALLSLINTGSVLAASGAMLIMSAALRVLVPALTMLDTIKDYDKVLLTLVVALASMAAVLVLLSLVPFPALLVGAAAMLVMAGSVLALSLALHFFGTPDANAAIETMISLLATVVTLGVASLIAGPGILVLSAAIIAFSASLIVLSLAIGVIVAVTSALLALGTVAISVIGLLSQTSFGKLLIEGLFSGIDLISDIWERIKSIGQSIVDGFKSFFGIHSPSVVMADQVGKPIMEGISEGIDEGKEYTDESINTWGSDFLTKIQGYMTDAGMSGDNVMPDIAKAFDGSSNLLTNSADNAGSNAYDALSSWLTQMSGAGDSVMPDIASGFDMSSMDVFSSIGDFGDGGYDAMTESLTKIIDPSNDVMPNIAGNLDLKSFMVNDSINNMGDSATATMHGALARLSNAVNDDLDINPVITPTIDVSKVKEGVLAINQMFGDAKIKALEEYERKNANSGSRTVNYTQINNSPKALSRTEIYRQTNNQLGVAFR